MSNVLEVVQAAQQAHSFSLILSIFQVDRLPIVEVKLGAAGFQLKVVLPKLGVVVVRLRRAGIVACGAGCRLLGTSLKMTDEAEPANFAAGRCGALV